MYIVADEYGDETADYAEVVERAAAHSEAALEWASAFGA